MGGKSAPKILLLTLSYPHVDHDANIYVDLAHALAQAGADVQVVAPAVDQLVGVNNEGGISVLRVSTGPLLNVGLVRKGIENLLLARRFGRAIRAHIRGWVPDWIVVPTPPITLTPLVEQLKRQWSARVFLVLRDIFPQNAVDLGIMPPGLAHSYFRSLERRTYRAADIIGCMSPGNAEYVALHNSDIKREKLLQFPNWISDQGFSLEGQSHLGEEPLWKKGVGDFLCVFGGNLGRPQRVDFLLDLACALRDDQGIRFVIVGDGTERRGLESMATARNLENVRVIARLSRAEYQTLIRRADLGLITLSERFTIPNIPSRLLGYWAAGVPVLAAVDAATDLGPAFLDRHQGGVCVAMGNVAEAVAAVRRLRSEPELRQRLGANGRAALRENYTAALAAQRMLNQMESVVRS